MSTPETPANPLVPSTEPVTAPVNPEVNKDDLGPKTTFGQKVGLEPTTPSITPTLGLKQNAGIAVGEKKNGEHVVVIKDFRESASHFYDWLIHCKDCGFESRISGDEKAATDVAQQHIVNKLKPAHQRLAEMNPVGTNHFNVTDVTPRKENDFTNPTTGKAPTIQKVDDIRNVTEEPKKQSV